jgi:antitoxin ParD1/3/4
MNVAISARWEKFVEDLVRSGRYASPAEVMELGLSLIEAREAEQEALRETIAASLAEEGGTLTDEQVGERLRDYLESRRDQTGRCAS